MNKKSIIALILAAALSVSACAMLAGCKKNDTNPTAATTATTATAATTAPKATTANGSANANNNNTASQAQGSSSQAGGNTAVDADGYISQELAVANVKEQAGSGAQIISVEKGKSPDGAAAWIVVVQPITNGEGAETVTYYSGYQFCYPESKSSSAAQSNEISISQQEAVANVMQQAGSGATVLNVEQGTSPDGFPCYVVTVQPITNGEGPDTVTYYSGYQFCYKAN